MITYTGSTLIVYDHTITLPIRINQILIIEDFILVALGFDASLDCGYIDDWTQEVDSKWNELHQNFNEPSLYCYDKLGIKIWEFSLQGFVNIVKLDDEITVNDLRVKSWILNNPNKVNVFIVDDGDRLIVDYITGEIYQRLEMR